MRRLGDLKSSDWRELAPHARRQPLARRCASQ
jgi:hypothetical protein